MFEAACDWISSPRLHHRNCMISTTYRWGQLSHSVCSCVFYLCTVPVTLEHDDGKNPQNLNVICKFNFILKHLLPLSPYITVKWLTVLPQGQALSAIWITAPPRLRWHHNAQLLQIWLKVNVSRASKLDRSHYTNAISTKSCLCIQITKRYYYTHEVCFLCAKHLWNSYFNAITLRENITLHYSFSIQGQVAMPSWPLQKKLLVFILVYFLVLQYFLHISTVKSLFSAYYKIMTHQPVQYISLFHKIKLICLVTNGWN